MPDNPHDLIHAVIRTVELWIDLILKRCSLYGGLPSFAPNYVALPSKDEPVDGRPFIEARNAVQKAIIAARRTGVAASALDILTDAVNYVGARYPASPTGGVAVLSGNIPRARDALVQLREASVRPAGRQLGGAADGGGRAAPDAGKPVMPPLGDNAARVYEKLLTLPEHRAMTGPKLCDWLQEEHNVLLDESTFRANIVPALKPYGLEHVPKIGYRIRPDRRPAP